MNDNRIPARTAPDAESLDGDEIVEGYRDGLRGEPCGDNRSRAYWHGWRNGMVDSRRAECDEAQRAVARDYVRRSRMH